MLLDVVIVSLAIIFLWGLIAPRGQWRALLSWTYRDPHAHEPSGAAYLLYRVVAALGIAGMVASGLFLYLSAEASRPPPSHPPTAAEKMWGFPEVVVVDRIFKSVEKTPTELVSQPILGYQELIGRRREPGYLFDLKTFETPQATTENGLIGTPPTPGLLALDTGNLVVQVQGDPLCFPRVVVVKEGSNTVTIGVYYGQANPADHSNEENVADCSTIADMHSIPTLIPIRLETPLDGRKVVTVEGNAVRKVALQQ